MYGTADHAEIFEGVKSMVDKVADELKSKALSYPIALLVSVEIKKDMIEEFLTAIKEDAKGSRLEEGCFRFDVLRDTENANKFKFYEVYTS